MGLMKSIISLIPEDKHDNRFLTIILLWGRTPHPLYHSGCVIPLTKRIWHKWLWKCQGWVQKSCLFFLSPYNTCSWSSGTWCKKSDHLQTPYFGETMWRRLGKEPRSADPSEPKLCINLAKVPNMQAEGLPDDSSSRPLYLPFSSWGF